MESLGTFIAGLLPYLKFVRVFIEDDMCIILRPNSISKLSFWACPTAYKRTFKQQDIQSGGEVYLQIKADTWKAEFDPEDIIYEGVRPLEVTYDQVEDVLLRRPIMAVGLHFENGTSRLLSFITEKSLEEAISENLNEDGTRDTELEEFAADSVASITKRKQLIDIRLKQPFA